MFEVHRAGFEWRNAPAVFGRFPRQERRSSIDAGVAEPRFGRRYQSRRHLAALHPAKLTDAVVAVGVPGEFQAPGRQFILARQIQVGWKHGAFIDNAQLHDLGDRNLMGLPILLGQAGVHVCQGTVCRAQVNTYDVTRRRHCTLKRS